MNLSQKEKNIIRMIAQEKPNKEIAFELMYSTRTIDYHISKMIRRFDVQTRVGIVARAYDLKLLVPGELWQNKDQSPSNSTLKESS
ncbi:response regulator transcription factor [Halobacillus sp. B23F22_1]|uniref:response regulator transcription factor n=1 Tax=Halobacillus sp. B23F22_1 TaxID=3459514 RepID=UPI00373F5FEC